MNKTRIKHIYLLTIIILGIVTLSVYSTYSIFTLEAESSDIVSIHTPSNLSVLADTYEYKQVSVPKNGYISTDIDIYNNLEYDVCYSVWYKVVNNDVDKSKVKVYQNTDAGLVVSSTLSSVENRRITLVIVNDNDVPVKVNVGLVYAESNGTCALNLAEDKTRIESTISSYKTLTNHLIENVQVKENEEGYLTYKDIKEEIKFGKEDKIYVSDKFDYANELFTLKDAEEITIDKLNEHSSKYTCLGSEECRALIHITKVDENNDIEKEEYDDNTYYKVTEYEKMEGYLASEVGLRKVGNDYYFFGDNPDNYMYYNCKNEIDKNSCEIWRILGFIYDNEEDKYITKIVRNDYLGKHQYDDSVNRWGMSTIEKYLSEYKLDNAIAYREYQFMEEYIDSLDNELKEIKYFEDVHKAKVTLLNLTDYINADTCKKDKYDEYTKECLKSNWLNKNKGQEWTMTVKKEETYVDPETEEEVVPENDKLFTIGTSILESKYDEELNVRPVLYLKSRTLLTGGTGTFEDPYIIK